MDATSAAAELDNILMPIADRLRVEGVGLHRVVYLNDKADALAERMGAHGIRVQIIKGGRLILAPSIDLPRNELNTLVDEISTLL